MPGSWFPQLGFIVTNLGDNGLSEVIVADHQRNYLACVSGYPECDPSRLTPTEASAVVAGKHTASR
jgi:hypothetical protein